MARYRKIDARMWADAKFRKLSPSQACGKFLWIALLTGPFTTNLPGLFRVGEMALAEELGWSLEGFRKAFAELLREGLAEADWSARVVWIRNAIKYNAPENPNVVKGWRHSWDEIPECALKAEAYQRLREFTERLGKGFGKAFVECCVEGLANQEQKQEQEQEQEREAAQSATPTATALITLPLNDGNEFPICGDQVAEWGSLYPAVKVMQELRKMRGWLQSNQRKRKTKDGILRFVTSWLNREQDKPHCINRDLANGDDNSGKLNRAEQRKVANLAAADEAIAILQSRMAN